MTRRRRIALGIGLVLFLTGSTTFFPPLFDLLDRDGEFIPARDSRAFAAERADHKAIPSAVLDIACDGAADDAPAINAAIQDARTKYPPTQGSAWPVGHLIRLTLPPRQCTIRSTLNMTGLYGSGFVADFWGSSILCKTKGTPCIDMTGTGQASLLGLNVVGAAEDAPNIGLMIGRRTNDGVGADHLEIDHPTITGFFTLAPYVNLGSETTLVNHAWFSNWVPNAYGAIFDGLNHFHLASVFAQNGTLKPDHQYSFNENTCIECIVEVFGDGDIALWMGQTARHRWINGYIYYHPALETPEPAVQLYFGDGAVNDFLDLDVHFEDQHLSSLVQFIGSSNPSVRSLHMRDSYPSQSGPLFSRGSGVNTVEIQDADLHFGFLAGHNPSWWDSPSSYDVSGTIYSLDGSYKKPRNFSGMSCVMSKCNFFRAL